MIFPESKPFSWILIEFTNSVNKNKYLECFFFSLFITSDSHVFYCTEEALSIIVLETRKMPRFVFWNISTSLFLLHNNLMVFILYQDNCCLSFVKGNIAYIFVNRVVHIVTSQYGCYKSIFPFSILCFTFSRMLRGVETFISQVPLSIRSALPMWQSYWNGKHLTL